MSSIEKVFEVFTSKIGRQKFEMSFYEQKKLMRKFHMEMQKKLSHQTLIKAGHGMLKSSLVICVLTTKRKRSLVCLYSNRKTNQLSRDQNANFQIHLHHFECS